MPNVHPKLLVAWTIVPLGDCFAIRMDIGKQLAVSVAEKHESDNLRLRNKITFEVWNCGLEESL